MWLGIPVEKLCNQHLLGLHSELHQEAGTIENHPHGEAIVRGHWKLGQVDTTQINKRHQETAEELQKRGYEHKSPLTYTDSVQLPASIIGFPIKKFNLIKLTSRCQKCKKRIQANN